MNKMLVYNKNLGSKIFDGANIGIMLCVLLVTLSPFWFCIVGSFNEGVDYNRGGVIFWPRQFTIANYIAVFYDKWIYQAYFISLARTLLGTVTHVLFTSLVAYGMSRKKLMGRNVYAAIIMFTMFFSGGLIPYYMLLKSLGLLDNFLVYIIPSLFNVWHMVIIQSSFREIPEDVIEAAKIDGAGEYRIYLNLILPLSKPVLAAIALFTGVWHWNSYYDSMIYTNSYSLQTIQVFLMKVILNSSEAAGLGQRAAIEIPEEAKTISPETIKLATMMVTTAPILIIYPFLQKYFVKGVMVGSIKG